MTSGKTAAGAAVSARRRRDFHLTRIRAAASPRDRLLAATGWLAAEARRAAAEDVLAVADRVAELAGALNTSHGRNGERAKR